MSNKCAYTPPDPNKLFVFVSKQRQRVVQKKNGTEEKGWLTHILNQVLKQTSTLKRLLNIAVFKLFFASLHYLTEKTEI